jgi:hypothetical protein
MSSRIATALLTVAFLASGAFGVSQAEDAGARTEASRTTVIEKSSLRPLPGLIAIEPCKRTVCWNV